MRSASHTVDMLEMVRIMGLVQRGERAVELHDRSEALVDICREVRGMVEYEAELQGRYTELMEEIGEEG